MRSFEQRLAEIDRRSKQIYSQRKQRRKRILTACIPAVLCISLFAAFLLPSGAANRAPGTQENLTEEIVQHPGNGSNTGSIEQIQVSGADEVHIYTDTGRICAILEQLHVLTEKTSGENYSGSSNTPSEPLYAMGSTCTIRLTLKHGEVHTYQLTGHRLTDMQTGCTYTLTQTELAALNEALWVGNGG